MAGPVPGGDPWRTRLPLLVTTHVVGTANVVSVMAMAPVITGDLGIGAIAFGTFVSAYYGAQACGSLPAGALTDRLGVARTLLVCHGAMALAALTMGLASGYAQCLGAMFLMGLGYALSNPSTARGVFDWFPAAKRGTAMGLKQVGVPLGGIAAAGSGALAGSVHWQTIMLAIAGLIAVNGGLCLFLLAADREQPAAQERPNPLANIRDVLGDGNFRRFAVLSGLLNAGQTNFFGFLALFLTEAARAGQPLAAFAIGLAQAASALARVGWGVVGDRWFLGRRKVLKAWICGAAALMLALMVLVAPGPLGIGIALVLTVGLGVTIASFAPTTQAIAVEAVAPHLAGSATGLTMVGLHLGGMLGPVAFGAAVDAFGGFQAGWLLTAAATALGTLMLVFWFREGRAAI